jgi:hypothetical protein
MPKITQRFRADQFTPTQFDSAAVKAEFANRLAEFIERDFPQHLFTKAFYRRLSMTFGHIAHTTINRAFGRRFSRTTTISSTFSITPSNIAPAARQSLPIAT